MGARAVAGGLIALLVIGSASAPAFGQAGTPGAPGSPGNFSANPHPTMPWSTNSTSRINHGQVLRYIPVQPQTVTIEVPVAVPDGIPPRTESQTHTIPGYYITETTTGYALPERWTIQQLNVGVYQWVKLPPEFRRK